MDNMLEKVRSSAVGNELDVELANQFPIRERRELNVAFGTDDYVHIYFYEPENRDGITPVIVNAHGGGFVKGYRGQDVVYARNMASNTGYLYVDIDYTPAPDKKYPYSVNQVYEAIKYVAGNHVQLNVDPKRIILMGSSAGATLMIAAAMMANESGAFRPCQIIMNYPPLDLVTDPLDKDLMGEPPEKAARGRIYTAWYVDPERAGEKYASPLFASQEDLEPLPPILLNIAGQDSLGAEAIKFTEKLINAGVELTVRRHVNSSHGFVVRRAEEYECAEKLIFEACRKYR